MRECDGVLHARVREGVLHVHETKETTGPDPDENRAQPQDPEREGPPSPQALAQAGRSLAWWLLWCTPAEAQEAAAERLLGNSSICPARRRRAAP